MKINYSEIEHLIESVEITGKKISCRFKKLKNSFIEASHICLEDDYENIEHHNSFEQIKCNEKNIPIFTTDNITQNLKPYPFTELSKKEGIINAFKNIIHNYEFVNNRWEFQSKKMD